MPSSPASKLCNQPHWFNLGVHRQVAIREIKRKTLEKVPCPLHLLLSTYVSALQGASNPCPLQDAYPRVPEELCKHHQVRSRQCQAHVCGSEGQDGHNLLL